MEHRRPSAFTPVAKRARTTSTSHSDEFYSKLWSKLVSVEANMPDFSKQIIKGRTSPDCSTIRCEDADNSSQPRLCVLLKDGPHTNMFLIPRKKLCKDDVILLKFAQSFNNNGIVIPKELNVLFRTIYLGQQMSHDFCSLVGEWHGRFLTNKVDPFASAVYTPGHIIALFAISLPALDDLK